MVLHFAEYGETDEGMAVMVPGMPGSLVGKRHPKGRGARLDLALVPVNKLVRRLTKTLESSRIKQSVIDSLR